VAKRKRKPRSAGRLDLAGAIDAPGGIAPAPPTDAIRRRIGQPSGTRVVAVSDPLDPKGTGRLLARSRVQDVLDVELHGRRITEAEHRVGRSIQRAFERASTVGGSSNWAGGSHLDPVTQSGLMALRWARAGGEAQAAIEAMRADGLGDSDVELVCMVLGQGLSYAAAAQHRRKLVEREQGARVGRDAGEREVRYVARRFRDALRELTVKRATATGPDKSRVRSFRPS
jgi:hypothetical protein